MTDQPRLARDAFAFVRAHGLEIEETDSPILDAALDPNTHRILLNRNLTDTSKAVFVVHEVVHYITKNYLADRNASAADFTTRGFQRSVVDVFFSERKRGEEHYRKVEEILSELDPDNDDDAVHIRGIQDIETRMRHAVPSLLKLASADTELQTWLLTRRFCERRLRQLKTLDNAEAVQFCNEKIKELSASALDVIRLSVERDDRMLATMTTALTGTADANGDENLLARQTALTNERRLAFEQAEIRWNRVKADAVQQNSLIAARIAEHSRDSHATMLIDDYEVALVVFSPVARLLGLGFVRPLEFGEDSSRPSWESQGPALAGWSFSSVQTARTVYEILAQRLQSHDSATWCLAPALLEERRVLWFVSHPALPEDLLVSARRLAALAGGEPLDLHDSSLSLAAIVALQANQELDLSAPFKIERWETSMRIPSPAHSIRLWLAPALTARDVLRWFNALSAAHPDISHYSYRESEKVQILKSTPGTPSSEERFVQVKDGNLVTLAWGADVSHDGTQGVLETLLAQERVLDPLQVTRFDARWHYDVDTASNHYLMIAVSLYSHDSVGRLNQSLRNDPELQGRQLDNDVTMLWSLGPNRTLMVEVTGHTTREEILRDQFDKNALKIVLGIQADNASVGSGALVDKIWQHWQFSCQLFEHHVLPTVVGPMFSIARALREVADSGAS